MMRRSVLTLLAIGLLTTSVSARDLFVNNVTGDDRRTGTDEAVTGELGGPVRTIRQALRRANKGDRIILTKTGRPYRESITLQASRHSGIRGQRFTIVGNGAVLDGTREIPPATWQYQGEGVYRFRPPRQIHQLLYVNGRPGNRKKAPRDQPLPELAEQEWCLYQGFLYFRPEKDKTPSAYTLSHTSLSVGLTLYEVRNVLISDLIVQGFQLDGVNAHDNVFDARLLSVTSRGNGRSGVSVGGASRLRIDSCLIGNNGTAQIRTEGFSKTEISADSDVIGNTAPRIIKKGGEVIELKPPAGAKKAGPALKSASARIDLFRRRR